MLLFKATED